MIKVSVIIPIYNVEKYLEDCLNSVINQTLKDIEIICIDDCSTDNSVSILEEFAKKDNRIIIIKNEENRGAGYTRNIGIKNSNGEYIGFVDSDDYISKDYFENLYNTAKKYNSDLVNTLNMIKIENNKKIFFYGNYIKNRIKREKEYSSKIKLSYLENYSTMSFISNNPVNKIIRRSFILDKQIFYMENKISVGEDLDFIIRLILNYPTIAFNNKSIYYYIFRDNSSMGKCSKDIEYNISLLDHLKNSIDYCKLNSQKDLQFLYEAICKTICGMLNNVSNKNIDKYFQLVKDFIDSNFYTDDEEIDFKNFSDEYILLKKSENVYEYHYNEKLYNLMHNVHNINNYIKQENARIKLFGIYNYEDRIIIILFGIKICIKKS